MVWSGMDIKIGRADAVTRETYNSDTNWTNWFSRFIIAHCLIDIVDKSEDEAKYEILSGIKDDKPRISKGYPSYYSLEHKDIDIDYYVDKTSIVYIKTCKSKVLVGGKNKVHNRVTWFADETIDLISLTDSVHIEPMDLRDTNLNYNVIFDYVLKEGEEIEFRMMYLRHMIKDGKEI